MKNFPHFTLPKLYGISKDDPDTFLEFNVLFWSYNYVIDAHNMNLFPSTLKYITLCWFVGLNHGNISSSEQMKEKFLTKYQYYCKAKERRERVFNKSLHKERQEDLTPETRRVLLLQGIWDDCQDLLNLIGGGDVSKLEYNDNIELCWIYYRGASIIGKGPWEMIIRHSKVATNGVARAELVKLLENFKTNLLNFLGSHLDILKNKKKNGEYEADLGIFYLKCKKRNQLREWWENHVEVCALCGNNHNTDKCLSLPSLKVVYEEAEEK